MDLDDSDDNIFSKSDYNTIPIDFDQLVESPENLADIYSNQGRLKNKEFDNSLGYYDSLQSQEDLLENIANHDNTGYIQHTITRDEIRMQIRHDDMPENLSHATLTVESHNKKTNEKEFKNSFVIMKDVKEHIVLLEI
ncbi:metal regulatory transcription factor 1 [Caerostris extrusa]|uniref:Metal regulatory transcription factor 1 n=1 Tax=Caerostris extrusa TaxID=172846 RepID=A0AAV4WHU0_CAEEX|nr:metal regulatory transcription factor 1 [Caerostris extrusa]